MRLKGKITTWNDERGFGFITPMAGGKRVFLHIKACENRNRRPEPGELVSYTLSTDKQGRPCAVSALLAGDRRPKKAGGGWHVFVASLFLLIVAASVIVSKIPLPVFIAYLIVSLLTYIVYAADKSAAKKGSWRTKESTLHLLAVIGGWPGALIAQQRLRHKSSKQSFRLVFWLTVFVNCAAYAWLYTPGGVATLQTFISALTRSFMTI